MTNEQALLYNEKVIKMYSTLNTFETYDLNQATQTYLQAAFKVRNSADI